MHTLDRKTIVRRIILILVLIAFAFLLFSIANKRILHVADWERRLAAADAPGVTEIYWEARRENNVAGKLAALTEEAKAHMSGLVAADGELRGGPIPPEDLGWLGGEVSDRPVRQLTIHETTLITSAELPAEGGTDGGGGEPPAILGAIYSELVGEYPRAAAAWLELVRLWGDRDEALGTESGDLPWMPWYERYGEVALVSSRYTLEYDSPDHDFSGAYNDIIVLLKEAGGRWRIAAWLTHAHGDSQRIPSAVD